MYPYCMVYGQEVHEGRTDQQWQMQQEHITCIYLHVALYNASTYLLYLYQEPDLRDRSHIERGVFITGINRCNRHALFL